jgi:integrase
MSVQKVPNGFKVRWLENGTHRSRKFRYKKDADAWDRDVKRRQQLGPLAVQQLTDRGPTLGEWIEGHWLPEHGVDLEPSTLVRYANVYDLHIAPTFNDTPLREITVSSLRAWQAALRKNSVGVGTIKKARTYLSSVLRHAAESEAIHANPLGLVRAPRPEGRPEVRPLSPAEVERIRLSSRHPADRVVKASAGGQRGRRAYALPAPGSELTNERDALIVSLIAYAGLRPGELKGLRISDIGAGTIRVGRRADEFGRLIELPKNGHRRSIRIFDALAKDIRNYRRALGNPSGESLLLHNGGKVWTKSDWNKWVADRWRPACRTAGLEPVPRPYDLRHSFASLLLAEGRTHTYVARQMGHSTTVLISTYEHLIEEYADETRIGAEAEIAMARKIWVAL